MGEGDAVTDLAGYLHALLDDDTQPESETDEDAELLGQLTNWDEFWDIDHNAADWLLEPIIATGRGHAMFAPGGTGKSLLALWLAAQAATGGPAFANYHNTPIDVLYLDYEMTNADLAERLENMGYGPDDDLSHLHYALLPSLPPLDKPEGGKAVNRLAELVGASLVVIDTHGRAVLGDENDADTVRAFYRWTGLHLKANGRAFVRVDHAGKDVEKGQRGSSAKNDDVDIVWQMTKGDAGAFIIKAKKRRMGWVPQEVTVVLHDDPVRYTLTTGAGYPAGTAELARTMDELGITVDATQRAAGAALRDAGKAAKNATLRAAIKYRKEEEMRTRIPVDDPNSQAHKRAPIGGARPFSGTRPESGGATGADDKPLVNGRGAAGGAAGRGPESLSPRAPFFRRGAGGDHPAEDDLGGFEF